MAAAAARETLEEAGVRGMIEVGLLAISPAHDCSDVQTAAPRLNQLRAEVKAEPL